MSKPKVANKLLQNEQTEFGNNEHIIVGDPSTTNCSLEAFQESTTHSIETAIFTIFLPTSKVRLVVEGGGRLLFLLRENPNK